MSRVEASFSSPKVSEPKMAQWLGIGVGVGVGAGQSSLALRKQVLCALSAERSSTSCRSITAVRQMADAIGVGAKTHAAANMVVLIVSVVSLAVKSSSQRAILVATHGEKPLKEFSSSENAAS